MKGGRRAILVFAVASLFTLPVVACALSGAKEVEPKVKIVAPAEGSTVYLGDTISIRAVVNEAQGIGSVQLWVDDQMTAQGGLPNAPVTQLTQCFAWTPNTSGVHRIKVVTHSNDGVQAVSEEIALHVSPESSPRKRDILAEPCTPFPMNMTTPLPTFTLPPRPAATATLAPITPVSCSDGAAFVAHVTIPDGSQLFKNTAFDKVWRLRNTGSCIWDTRYELVFVGDSQMGGPSAVTIPQVIPPSGVVDISVPMVAPDAIGNYRGRWQMRNPGGVNFGAVVQVLIEVRPGPDDPPLITQFKVEPSNIIQCESATISWEYINGAFARLYPDGQAVGSTGSLVVSPNSTTSYRLVVNNTIGTVERTITLFVQPLPNPPSPPSSPANLTIVATHPHGFDFSWVDTSSNEQGFRLLNADTRQELVTFGPNATSGAVSDLACETSYRFFLVAFNVGGESFPSGTVQATTSACDG